MRSAKCSDFLTPSPSPHLEPMFTIKFTQPSLLRPLFHDPPPPFCGHHIWMLPDRRRLSHRGSSAWLLRKLSYPTYSNCRGSCATLAQGLAQPHTQSQSLSLISEDLRNGASLAKRPNPAPPMRISRETFPVVSRAKTTLKHTLSGRVCFPALHFAS